MRRIVIRRSSPWPICPRKCKRRSSRFFISYNQVHGKEFKPLGIKGPNRALKLIKEGEQRFHKQEGKKRSKART